MKIHPRHFLVQNAQIEFSRFWISFLEKHDLTMSEFLSILGAEMQSTINICLRTEREKDEHNGLESGRQKDGD